MNAENNGHGHKEKCRFISDTYPTEPCNCGKWYRLHLARKLKHAAQAKRKS